MLVYTDELICVCTCKDTCSSKGWKTGQFCESQFNFTVSVLGMELRSSELAACVLTQVGMVHLTIILGVCCV